MEERLTLSSTELKRVKVLEMIEAEQMTVAQAPKSWALASGIAGGCWRATVQQGRLGWCMATVAAIQPAVARRRAGRVLALAEGVCRDYNDQHLTEVLQEEHGLQVSRASVRRIRRRAGLASPHKYRRRRSHLRRERYPQPGMLLQIDASLHDWLEGAGRAWPWWGRSTMRPIRWWGPVPRARRCRGLLPVASRHRPALWVPLALYADRHTIFQSPLKPTIEQELAGELPKSQFGRLSPNWASN